MENWHSVERLQFWIHDIIITGHKLYNVMQIDDCISVAMDTVID